MDARDGRERWRDLTARSVYLSWRHVRRLAAHVLLLDTQRWACRVGFGRRVRPRRRSLTTLLYDFFTPKRDKGRFHVLSLLKNKQPSMP